MAIYTALQAIHNGGQLDQVDNDSNSHQVYLSSFLQRMVSVNNDLQPPVEMPTEMNDREGEKEKKIYKKNSQIQNSNSVVSHAFLMYHVNAFSFSFHTQSLG